MNYKPLFRIHTNLYHSILENDQIYEEINNFMSKINQPKGANCNKISAIHQQFALVFVTNHTFCGVHCCKYSFVTHQRDYIRIFQLKVAFFQNQT